MEAKLLAEEAKSEGKILYQVFLNLTKAYDTVNWERLFILLQHYGLRPRCRAALQGTWMDSVLVPKMGGWYGKPVPTRRGVRQGDVISPTLFNILVDAILRHEELQWDIEGRSEISTRVCFYADDGAISGTDATTIQNRWTQSLMDLRDLEYTSIPKNEVEVCRWENMGKLHSTWGVL